MKKKLLVLRLKEINQYWSYDLEGIFDIILRNQPNPPSFKAKSRLDL